MLRTLCLAAAVCLLVSCGSSSTAPTSNNSLDVVVSPSTANILPGQSVQTTITVTPTPDNMRVDSLVIQTSGVLTSHQTIAIGLPGTFTTTQAFTAPAAAGVGTLTISAIAHASRYTGSGNTKIAVADTTHPALQVSLTPQATILQPGDSIAVSISAQDVAALGYTTVKLTGAVTLTDSANANGAPYVSRTLHAQIPLNAPVNKTLQITATASNIGGVVTKQTLPSITVADTSHPVVTGTLQATHAGSGAAPGDQITLTVNAKERFALAYVGYRLGAPANTADSVKTTATSATLTRSITVPSSWVGVSSITIFAVDANGNRSSAVLGDLTVATRTRRAIASAALPAGAVRDATYDAVRNTLYMSVPTLQQVAVLKLSSMTYGTPYAFSASPHGLDLTPGGDSLVVALVETPNVAIINLTNGTTTTMPVISGSGPDFLRVTNNNKVIVTITFAGSGYGGSLIEANLATGATRNLKTVTEYVPLAGSGSRARVLALIDDSCCPEEAVVYDASTGAIISDAGTVSNFFNWVSADFPGNNFLIQSSEYNSALSLINAYGGSAYTGGPSAVSADGASGYFATTTGVVHVRFSDGAVLDTFTLSEQPAGLWMSRDGLTLFAVGSAHVFDIDLW